jgi:hypothetical protein
MMATKRESPGPKRESAGPKRESLGKRTVKKKTAAPAPEAMDAAATVVLESAQSTAVLTAGLDPDTRRQLVAAEAYFLAERRGFAAGHELEDWAAAEMAVNSRLNHL